MTIILIFIFWEISAGINQPKIIGWVAFAGPFIATLGIYLLSLWLLHWKKITPYPFLFYFIAWINLHNLSELASYTILRAFSVHGDVGHIVFGGGMGAGLWKLKILLMCCSI